MLLPSLICKSNIEADFLPSFQLHYAAVVDHQLDGAVADRPERLTELLEERWGHRGQVVRARVRQGRNGRLGCHDPIYPI
jgi:hypothetical protein